MKARHAVALALTLIVSRTPSAIAMNTEEDSLSEVSGSSAILEMLSGQIYKVDDANQADSAIWLATDDVLICSQSFVVKGKTLHSYKIINKDENGEEVDATRLQ